jgi:hypothetical protein
MQLCIYTVMQLCSYAVMQLCSYAVMRLCGYAVMQLYNCHSAHNLQIIYRSLIEQYGLNLSVQICFFKNNLTAILDIDLLLTFASELSCHQLFILLKG